MTEKELHRRLDQAITDVLNVVSPGVPTAWILMAHQASFDENGDGLSSYPMILMNDSLPDHVIRGLLDIANDHVRGIGKWAHAHDHEDDEDYEGEE